MSRTFYLGIDLGTTLGVAKLFTDGSLEAQSLRLKPTIADRCTGLAGVLERHAGPDCLGVCIEAPFSGQFSSVKALFPMLGAAVLKCEELKLPWMVVHLSALKIHATGKGNAKKPEMQAAARARWGAELKEDEADAAWAAAFIADL